ncbi:MAG: 2OG-Fe(II) oxygenase [Ferrovibrio sp.]|uniref:2OG-Fe(II) oxygenase n=1 Tax=Ferrovibrio sp. TaxID=1917215 RepID=UPI00261C70D6|nr:2OG-Fe(II) oxygenase [Ferrovibrio sp.]MCW0236669.1 2OG-Fe(II) oxygenase [Ferrovibrio sp.]
MTADLAARIDSLDWPALLGRLEASGFATTGPLLTAAECAALAALYDAPAHFRSRVVMARHGFGQGEYRYFSYPLPAAIQTLRETIYPRLAPLANRWQQQMGRTEKFPAAHADYIADCHAAGQTRPTPLLLRYGPGDYNRLHQDLYGELVFPLQLTLLLSDPATFSGGDFVLVENKPRSQSRAEVVRLQQGEAVLFAVSQRPVAGPRGPYRVALRHGVSTLHGGRRHTLGIIFHDAG